MTAPSPFGPAQDQRDADQLKLLAIFHYVVAGLGLLGGGFLILHFLIMKAVMSGVLGKTPNSSPLPPQILEFLKIFYGAFGFILAVAIVLNVVSAIFLHQRKHRMFSIVVACINCLQVPLGTVLGVFTLIVLMRESVRESYDRTALEN